MPRHRLRLPVERNGFSIPIAPGVRLNYRRNARGAGTWSVKVSDGMRSSTMHRLGIADDFDRADGEYVLNYEQAREAAVLAAAHKKSGGRRIFKKLGSQ